MEESRTPYTAREVEQFRKLARKLKHAEPTSSQNAALDHIAVERGWPNWPLLHKNSIPDDLRSLIVFTIMPHPGEQHSPAHPGVFVVEGQITHSGLNRRLGDEFRFALPHFNAWLFRPATTPDFRHAPYLELDASTGAKVGIFKGGCWKAVLSTNGTPESGVNAQVADDMDIIRNALELSSATAASDRLKGLATPSTETIKLYLSRAHSSGVPSIETRTFATLDDAKQARLDPGEQAIGIPTAGGWLFYQPAFGWQGPFAA
jgi:hypothetical protein